MATNESDFKSDFRKDLQSFFMDKVVVWTNNDMFVSGLPDFSCHYNGIFYPIEAKFFSKVPKKGTSKVLTHEVSDKQISFIQKIRNTGGRGAILIGMPDVAFLVSDLKNNYTLDEVRESPRIQRKGGHWCVENFFNILNTF